MSLSTVLRLVVSTSVGLGLAMSAVAADAPAKRPAKKRAAAVKAAPLVAAPLAPLEDLTPDQLASAERVYLGSNACEFNQSVDVVADADKKGYFVLSFAGKTYVMAPEPTTTGAVRLEDKKNGLVWLQIANKSMLMNAKIGQRMVDNCIHPSQKA